MSRVEINVNLLEFEEGGRTIWVQGVGGTVLRIQLPRGTKIETRRCAQQASGSHLDLTIEVLAPGPVVACLGGLDSNGTQHDRDTAAQAVRDYGGFDL